MTKHSKCEVCRARKIKCDEARPRCGLCERKGRTCVYKNDNDALFVHEGFSGLETRSQIPSASPSRSSSYRSDRSEGAVDARRPAKDVTLRLKRSRKAETGSGEFLIFGRSRRQHSIKGEPLTEIDDQEPTTLSGRRGTLSPSPLSTVSRPQDSLAARWMSIAGSASLSLNPLGSWVKLAWEHVGNNAYLDLAVDYALAAITAFRQQNYKDFVKISAVGGRAMRRLRDAITSGTKCVDVYVAIMLHYAAEHFRGMHSCYWVSHMSAISQLLSSELPDADEAEIVQSILHITRDDEIVEAVLNGQVSLFEGKVSPTTALGSLELDIAVSELDRLYVKLPRLVFLVRGAREHPKNHDAAVQAIALASELHNSKGTLTIRRTLTEVMERARAEPTTLPSFPVPTAFHFDSIPDFVLATRFFIFRMILSGLIQRLCDLQDKQPSFDRSAVEAEDVGAGTSVLQCVEWALQSDPLLVLRMLIPIQIGFGVWDRLEKRQVSSETEEYSRAVQMKAATIEIANQIDVIWGNRLTAPWRLGQICDMFAGGPLHEWMYNYRSVAGYETA